MLSIEEIKSFMKSKGITYKDLSDISKIPIGSLKQIFCGRVKNPRVDTMQSILLALGLTGSDYFAIPEIEPLPNLRPVPLLGTIACGEPILAEENIEKYVGLPEDIKADFALRCKGDSMINARIFDGDLVFIKQQPEVNNGEIAAVLIDNEATLKRVYKYPSGIELRAENPLFAPINITSDDKVEVKILGKAVSFLSKVV